jgi:hypothetical protein
MDETHAHPIGTEVRHPTLGTGVVIPSTWQRGIDLVRVAFDDDTVGTETIRSDALEAINVDYVYPDFQDEEGLSCSICDALGHGYPGGGPCPLESPDPGYYADELAAGR